MSLDLVEIVTVGPPDLARLEAPLVAELKRSGVDEVFVVLHHDTAVDAWRTSFWVEQEARERLAVAPIARELSQHVSVLLIGEFPHAGLWEAHRLDAGHVGWSDQGYACMRRGLEALLGRVLTDAQVPPWGASGPDRIHRASVDGLERTGQQEHPADAGLGPSIAVDVPADPTPEALAWEEDHDAACLAYDAFWGVEQDTREGRMGSGFGAALRDAFPVLGDGLSLEIADYALREPTSEDPRSIQPVTLILRTVRWASSEVVDVVEQAVPALLRPVVLDGRFSGKTEVWWSGATQARMEQRVRADLAKLAAKAQAALARGHAETPTPADLVW